jgi:hypothetical protein
MDMEILHCGFKISGQLPNIEQTKRILKKQNKRQITLNECRLGLSCFKSKFKSYPWRSTAHPTSHAN